MASGSTILHLMFRKSLHLPHRGLLYISSWECQGEKNTGYQVGMTKSELSQVELKLSASSYTGHLPEWLNQPHTAVIPGNSNHSFAIPEFSHQLREHYRWSRHTNRLKPQTTIISFLLKEDDLICYSLDLYYPHFMRLPLKTCSINFLITIFFYHGVNRNLSDLNLGNHRTLFPLPNYMILSVL